MANVISQPPPVNPTATVQQVIEWVEKQSSKADMGDASARIRITALRQMAEQIADDEEKDAAAMLRNMDRLRERWARRNPDLQSGTAKTYAKRASATLAEYFKWEAAPDKYDPKRVVAKKDDASKKVAKLETSAAAPRESRSVMAGARVCPLGGGREFLYTAPVDGFLVKDAMRIAYHFITMCEDFDPSMSPAQVMANAMQRTG